MKDKLKRIHFKAGWHRQNIIKSKICGCFYCLEFFSPSDIKEWIDELLDGSRGPGQTALCPKCGIDSVLPDKLDCVLDLKLLEAMNREYFSEKTRSTRPC